MLLAVAALLAGVAAARLPLLWMAAGFGVLVLVALTLAEPVVGLCAALVLGPTKPFTDVYVPEFPLDAGQLLLVLTLGAWFLHAARRHRIRVPHSPLNVPVLIFLGAVALSLVNALSLGYALEELVKWGQILLVMWLVVDMGRRGRWRAVLGAVLGGAAMQAAIGVWQFGLRGDGPEHFLILGDRFYRAYGTFEQPNPYGGFLGLALAVAVGLALVGLEQWFSPVWGALRSQRPVNARRVAAALLNKNVWRLAALAVLAGLMLVGLLASWSRGAWLGFAAAAVAILFAWPRRAWLGALLVVGGVGLGLLLLASGLLPAAIADRLTGFTAFVQTFDVRGVDITTANFAVIERLAHWWTAQEMARYNFWLGVGIGNYEPVYPAYALMNWPQPLGHAHNFYLNLLAETGIIGAVAYGLMWAAVIWQTWRVTRSGADWRRGVAIGLFGAWAHLSVHHLVDKLYVANLHLHIGALFGILTILSALERNPEAEASTIVD